MHDRDAALQAIKAALQDSSEAERAEFLAHAIRVFYDWTKFQAPGGEGLDGRDGRERNAIGKLWADADNYRHEVQSRRL